MPSPPEQPPVNAWQSNAARFCGPIFIVIGCIALIGSWMITDPTVEKINMVVGAMIFFGMYVIMLQVGLGREITQLKSQVESLLKDRDS